MGGLGAAVLVCVLVVGTGRQAGKQSGWICWLAARLAVAPWRPP